jgi:hypothetical protein
MTLIADDEAHVFDCFECAIHALAPRCCHCGCRIIGHGVGRDREVFCGGHCAQESAVLAGEPIGDRS